VRARPCSTSSLREVFLRYSMGSWLAVDTAAMSEEIMKIGAQNDSPNIKRVRNFP
jgi:hypothetical protein